jgi:hypothetical protein
MKVHSDEIRRCRRDIYLLCQRKRPSPAKAEALRSEVRRNMKAYNLLNKAPFKIAEGTAAHWKFVDLMGSLPEEVNLLAEEQDEAHLASSSDAKAEVGRLVVAYIGLSATDRRNFLRLVKKV